MPKAIDWMYFRKGCETCRKTADHLAAAGVAVSETVDAVKVRKGRDDALAVLAGVSELVVVRGKKVQRLDLGRDRPGDDALAALLLGPTGNLRAPTIRVGGTLVVGFAPEAYAAALGAT